jgi:Uncharacterized protein conserved in bacteria
MAASADQTSSRTAGDDRNLVTIDENYLAPTLEDKLLIFWEKNGRSVIAVVVLVAVGLIARWGFQVFAENRERAIAAEYAAANDSVALKAFAESQPTAALSGVAYLRLADEAYAEGRFAAAQADYDSAKKILGNNILGDRARLGSAISQIQAGDAAGGKTALEALANDVSYLGTLRGEAAFHLAVLAREAGQPAEARKWVELTLSADPTGLWAQRAMQLSIGLPEDPASTEAPANSEGGTASPEVSFSAPQ